MNKKISKLLVAFMLGCNLTGCFVDNTTSDAHMNNEAITNTTSDILYAYTIDDDNLGNIPIDLEVVYTGDIMEAIKNLATVLSDSTFNGLDIEIVGQENIDGKQIVTINLQDSDKGTWYNYFQGSTGGMVTARSLEETFLQRDYPGVWIDGIKFEYNGEPMPELDHTVGLETTLYR